ncbi:MAG: tetratricopeptide repeat protein [Verrucomicrobiota bacterium]
MTLQAADSPQAQRAFNAAMMALNDGFYERAEESFAQYAQSFPESERYAEAVLGRARSRYYLKNFDGAVQVLNDGIARAGKLGDQFLYWLGEIHFQRKDYPAAATAYASVPVKFPNSKLVLEAAHGEALCRFKQGQHAQVIQLLQKPDGAFARAAAARARDPLVQNGYLLLAEAMLAGKQFKEGEEFLNTLDEQRLNPEQLFQRQYLLVHLQQGAQRLADASQSAGRLLSLAQATGKPALLAESVAVQANLLERLDQPDAAAQVYEMNLAEGTPPERKREALLKIIELTVKRDKTQEAAQRLEQFLKANPNDPSLDVVLVTLGELRLKDFYKASDKAAATNLLQQAQTFLDQAIANHTSSPFLGKAHLQRGWCKWEAAKPAESQSDFKRASELLPPSDDKAIAVFKWADTQFQLNDFAGALTNYERVIAEFDGIARVKNSLFDLALYQIARSAVRSGNLGAAEGALRRILQWYPDSYFSDRSVLLVAQALNREGKPGDARAQFKEFLDKFPQSALAPEVELAMARTYALERDWPGAIKVYDGWIASHTNHQARARAEYDRGWLNYKAGHETNALMIYTNFLAQFPTNTLAAQAQYWVADFYFRQGNLTEAEKHFQRIFQNTNWPSSKLTYQARLSAGRAAFARQGFPDARSYFTNLVNDSQCPPEIQAQAWMGLGDVFAEEPVLDSANKLDNFARAIVAFEKVETYFSPTNRLVAAAWGRIANCHQQLGTQEPARYDQAIKFYQQVTNVAALHGDPVMLGEALVGMGQVYEKQARARPAPEQEALFKHALDRYFDAFDGRIGEPDPFWAQAGGLAAGKLLEDLQRGADAIKVYARLQQLLPPMRTALEKKINQLREQANGGKAN